MSQNLYKFEVAFQEECLRFQLARHPSEGDEYFITRALAYVLNYQAGITAYGQVCQGGERPALAVFNPDQSIGIWIEIGLPSEGKVKMALRQSEIVMIYLYKQQHAQLRRLLDHLPNRERLGDRLRAFAFAADFLRTLHQDIGPRIIWQMEQDAEILTVNGFQGRLEQLC